MCERVNEDPGTYSGIRNDKLVEFGVQPFRSRSKTTPTTPAPEPGTPDPAPATTLPNK
ncbi:MAG: hypothetical protein WAM82_18305 [Thermoanaerobaculia bacterium]